MHPARGRPGLSPAQRHQAAALGKAAHANAAMGITASQEATVHHLNHRAGIVVIYAIVAVVALGLGLLGFWLGMASSVHIDGEVSALQANIEEASPSASHPTSYTFAAPPGVTADAEGFHLVNTSGTPVAPSLPGLVTNAGVTLPPAATSSLAGYTQAIALTNLPPGAYYVFIQVHVRLSLESVGFNMPVAAMGLWRGDELVLTTSTGNRRTTSTVSVIEPMILEGEVVTTSNNLSLTFLGQLGDFSIDVTPTASYANFHPLENFLTH